MQEGVVHIVHTQKKSQNLTTAPPCTQRTIGMTSFKEQMYALDEPTPPTSLRTYYMDGPEQYKLTIKNIFVEWQKPFHVVYNFCGNTDVDFTKCAKDKEKAYISHFFIQFNNILKDYYMYTNSNLPLVCYSKLTAFLQVTTLKFINKG